jgi:hypothetical protein
MHRELFDCAYCNAFALVSPGLSSAPSLTALQCPNATPDPHWTSQGLKHLRRQTAWQPDHHARPAGIFLLTPAAALAQPEAARVAQHYLIMLPKQADKQLHSICIHPTSAKPPTPIHRCIISRYCEWTKNSQPTRAGKINGTTPSYWGAMPLWIHLARCFFFSLSGQT